MGKRAKLKKMRKEQQQKPKAASSDNFIKELGKQGYNLSKIQRSPEVPEDKPEPQV